MFQSKTLVVEDDHDIEQLLAITMKKAGFEAGVSENCHEALNPTCSHQPGLLILDLMIPGIDGLDLYEEIDRIIGLESWADDEVVKPFSPRELLLRVRVILRRPGHEYKPRAVFKKSGMEIDFEAHRVSFDGHEIVLTAMQFKLLAALVKSPGRVLNREQLLDKVWGYHFEGYARAVDTQISRLRQKLLSCADWIETVRGVGYRFRN
jgi:two-component system phosphate regulon response regulator PhoB